MNTRLHSWFTLPRPEYSSIAKGILAPRTLVAYQSGCGSSSSRVVVTGVGRCDSTCNLSFDVKRAAVFVGRGEGNAAPWETRPFVYNLAMSLGMFPTCRAGDAVIGRAEFELAQQIGGTRGGNTRRCRSPLRRFPSFSSIRPPINRCPSPYVPRVEDRVRRREPLRHTPECHPFLGTLCGNVHRFRGQVVQTCPAFHATLLSFEQ